MRKVYFILAVLLLSGSVVGSVYASPLLYPCPDWEFVYGSDHYYIDCAPIVGQTENFTQATVYSSQYPPENGDSPETLIIRKDGLFLSGQSYESFYMIPVQRDESDYPNSISFVQTQLPSSYSVRLEIVDNYDGNRTLCFYRAGYTFSAPVTASCPNNSYHPGIGAYAVVTVEKGYEFIWEGHGVAIRHGTVPVPTATRTNTPVPTSPTPTPSPTPSSTSCGGIYDWTFRDGSGVLSRSLITTGIEYIFCPNPSALPIPSFLIPDHPTETQYSSTAVSVVSNSFNVGTGSPVFGINAKAYTWDDSTNQYIWGAPDGGRIELFMEVAGNWQSCGFSASGGNNITLSCFLPSGGTTRFRVDVQGSEAGGYGLDFAQPSGTGQCPTIGGVGMDYRPSTLNCCVTLNANKSFIGTGTGSYSGRQAYGIDFPVSVSGWLGQEMGVLSVGTLANWTWTVDRYYFPRTVIETCSSPTGCAGVSGGVGSINSNTGSIFGSSTAVAVGFSEHSLTAPFGTYNAVPFTVELCSPAGSLATATPTNTPTPTRTPSPTGTPPSPTPTFPTGVYTRTPTPPVGSSSTPTRTRTPTRTPNPSHSATPSFTPNPAFTATLTPNPSGTPTPSPSPAGYPTQTNTPLPSLTPSVTNTPNPDWTATAIPTLSVPTPPAFPTVSVPTPPPFDPNSFEGLEDYIWSRYPFNIFGEWWLWLGFDEVEEDTVPIPYFTSTGVPAFGGGAGGILDLEIAFYEIDFGSVAPYSRLLVRIVFVLGWFWHVWYMVSNYLGVPVGRLPTPQEQKYHTENIENASERGEFGIKPPKYPRGRGRG